MMNSQNNFEEEKIADNNGAEESSTVYRAKKKPKMSLKKKLAIIIPSSVVGLVAILTATALILVQMGKISMLNTGSMNIDPGNNVSDVETTDGGETVTYGGVTYKYNENMTAILCMGVDREEFADEESVIGKKGQADAIFLFCMDTSTGKSTIIPVPRDTLTDVDIYSVENKYIASNKTHLCLAYAYGDGQHKSCENTVKSVSRLFYGLPISSYVAVDLKAIRYLTDAVGGVTVVPVKDYSYENTYYTAGKEMTLFGKNAQEFVQSRDMEDVNGSLDRLERQKIFIQAFFGKVLEKTKEDIKTPVNLYKSASKYMVTDLSVSDISFMTSVMLTGKKGMEINFKSISGEMVKGEEYLEYHPDNASIYNTIIDVFYIPA